MTTLNHEPGDDLAAAVTVPSKQLVAIRPRFNDDERRRLHVEHELTTEQIALLERHLGVILNQLGPHDRMQDVRSDLQGLCKVLTKAEDGFSLDRLLHDDTYPAMTLRKMGLLKAASQRL